MTSRPIYYPVGGGLDQESAGITVPPGRLIAVNNYERVSRGYQSIEGYERADGHPPPSGVDGVGRFATPEALAAWSEQVEARRALIQQPPGSGPVRGVLFYNNKLHAWRDNAEGTQGKVYYSSATGWQAHDLGREMFFRNGGPYIIQPGDVIEGATSHATATVRGVYTEADARWETGNAFGTFILDNIVGTFQNESIFVNSGDDVAADVEDDPQLVTIPPGGRYRFIIHNFYGAVGFGRAYGVNGVGRAFEFDGNSMGFISTGMPEDKPFLIAEYKKHMFLAFPKGSLQNSALGDPRSFSALLDAAEIGLGKELTNIIPNAADTLVITTTASVAALTGNDSSDFLLTTLSEETGAYLLTAQRLGNILYMDEGGIRSASTTSTYGNFKLGSYSALIQQTLDEKRKAGVMPVDSMIVKGKDQYLLFFNDGSGISIYMGGKAPEAMLFQYPFVVTCSGAWEVDGQERIFIGTNTGWVYELNVGTSFDGEDIETFAQFPFGNQGGPRMLKRYHKAVVQMVANPGTEIALSAEFDYNGPNQTYSHDAVFGVKGYGGVWGSSEYGGFTWTSPTTAEAEFYLQGVGENMSPIIYSKSSIMDAHILQGYFVMFSPRGQRR